jgi:regulator of RNase E activity RraA
MPIDIIVGDGDGVVAIPTQIADEKAIDTYEQEYPYGQEFIKPIKVK